MLLENKYYHLIRVEDSESPLTKTYHLALNLDCDVYRGHFPGNPVCPGVCNIETIKECAMMLTGKKLLISTIKQCRLTAVATPSICPEISVKITATEVQQGYMILATIADAHQTYMEYKGDMIIL